jgi:D-3-phosphoglycerate dehydrogenase
VLIAEELAPSVLAVLGDGFEIRHVDGADRAGLLPALADATPCSSAARRRSTTRRWRAPRLKVVARAGIGLDNVDVTAATARGVMVVNAPQSNIVSAPSRPSRCCWPAPATWRRQRRAEAGQVAAQQVDRRRGRRQDVGVVGLGRIGVLFASACRRSAPA